MQNFDLTFNTLKKNLKKDFTTLKTIKVCILGDSATQFLNQALRGYGYELGCNFEIYEADYNQIDAQILDISSPLYTFKPQFTLIFSSVQKLEKQFVKSSRTQFANEQIKQLELYQSTITQHFNTTILYFNFPELIDTVFGNYANKVEQSFSFQVRKLNYELMLFSQRTPTIHIIDYAAISSHYGKTFLTDAKMYYTADMVLSMDALPIIAKTVGNYIQAINGQFKKCLIIDLDNTMWGGIIGDDGLEGIEIGDLGIGKAFTELQYWFKELKERGIILAVCSKNEEATAKEPFEKHPDMVLHLEDIAVFVANWNNKADNIRYIQQVLNIGFDSMVFLDDNPAEREIVRTNLPAVLVPELPEDPSLYLEYLSKLNLFETASYSAEDKLRTLQYQEEAGRVSAQKNFTNEDDFLKSLQMTSEVKAFDTFSIPRVAQLSQRSNQFNLRTVRYTEASVLQISESPQHITRSFNLVDKFGNNGLIALIVLEKQNENLFIETWLMSCRVLKRGMENFTLNTLMEIAKEQGFKKLVGEYLPTAKNTMVKDHYEKLGFTESNGLWHLDVETYQTKKCFIN